MFDETISCVQLDLMVLRNQVNQRLKQLLGQLEAFERMRPEEITPEVRVRIDTVERSLMELKRQQQEIVEQSLKNMFEMSTMIAREKEGLMQITASADKLEGYQEALDKL